MHIYISYCLLYSYRQLVVTGCKVYVICYGPSFGHGQKLDHIWHAPINISWW